MITIRLFSQRYGGALLLTAALTAILFFVETPLETTTIVLGYLLAVLVVATTGGPGPGILTSLISFLAFNFFFLSPRYTFHVANTQDVLHLLSFLAVAIIASSLAARAACRRARAPPRRRAGRALRPEPDD
jgi:two-component system, OmpR family, sensor histidine kinase KdpD